MTPEKLRKNLEKLRNEIARKPSIYTSEYAKTIKESFTKYTRTSSVNILSGSNEMLSAHKWPFPVYNLGSELGFIKLIAIASLIIFKLKCYEYLRFIAGRGMSSELPINDLQPHLDEIMCRHFSLCKKKIFTEWKTNPVFIDKHYLIDNIHKTYRKGYWYACMVSALPLLDLVCRHFLKTRKHKDIKIIVAIFRSAGVTARDVKPGLGWVEGEEKSNENTVERDFRLIGIALGSFLDFADEYYAYFRKTKSNSEITINRHAIIHCLVDDIWTQENATRILIFLDLTLHLEPVFGILLNEN